MYKRDVKGACQALKGSCAVTLQQLSLGSSRLKELCSADASCQKFVLCVEIELVKAKCESDARLSSGVKSIRSECNRMQGLSQKCTAEISSKEVWPCNNGSPTPTRELASAGRTSGPATARSAHQRISQR